MLVNGSFQCSSKLAITDVISINILLKLHNQTSTPCQKHSLQNYIMNYNAIDQKKKIQ